MADKVMFRFWTITDYEEEEEFLRQQHREGWKFRKYWLPGFYFFDKCSPEDVVYRLDFDQAAKGEKAAYLQLYRDYGWEYLLDVNGFSYFRKSAEAVNEDGDTEIFSDNESRLEMVKRIFRRRMLPLLAIFLCCLMPQLMIQSGLWFDGGDTASKVLTVILFVLFVAYIWLFIHCGIGIRRLERKYKTND